VKRRRLVKRATVARINPHFDGETYEPHLDHERLTTQLARVRWLVSNGQWWTLARLAQLAGGSEASVSARLRDLRKPKFGGLTVERERIDGGLFQYRVKADQ
jgi:hypothetical protein